jgi:predicted AlkP superfamily pyrophosphatase or phosphodiesterase
VRALLEPTESTPAWLPAPAASADQVVLLVLDGLGWEQLLARPELASNLCGAAGGPITTVAPSTTASALTSISTGLPPGEHGVIGYRMHVGGGASDDVLNVLRWSIVGRDGRAALAPDSVQDHEVFCGHRPAIVTRTEFRNSGFTEAHLAGVRFSGYRVTSTLVAEIGRHLDADEPFVYAYYDGVDKVAHEYGFGPIYDAEVAFVDRLVADIVATLPPGAALVVTADHGQVHVGDHKIPLASPVLANTSMLSGEARFRWLHARDGRVEALLDAASEHHGDNAWVVTRSEIVDSGWFGPKVTDASRARLGDVALVAKGSAAFVDPDDSGPYELIGRHGSLTSAEMLVPLVALGG